MGGLKPVAKTIAVKATKYLVFIVDSFMIDLSNFASEAS
jgi:hypothetical protein